MAVIEIDAYVENVDEVMGTYDQIKLFKDTDPAGAFSTTADTEDLVAGQTDYTLTDPSGSSAYVYRHAFFHSVSLAQSALSDAYYPTGRNVADILIAASKRCRGFESTASAAGEATILYDEQLVEHGLDSDYLSGGYLFRPDAQPADYQRRTAQNPFDTVGSGLSVIRAWGTPPEEDERYAFFPLMPPVTGGPGGKSWLECLGEALTKTDYPDEIDLGPGTADGNNRFDLAVHVGYLENLQVRRVSKRVILNEETGYYEDWDASRNQGYWEFDENGRDQASLEIWPPPLTTERVVVKINRRFDRVYRIEDITLAPFELAVLRTVEFVYRHLNEVSDGKYATRLKAATASYLEERNFTRPLKAVRS